MIRCPWKKVLYIKICFILTKKLSPRTLKVSLIAVHKKYSLIP